VILAKGGGRRAVLMRWGLTPGWAAKDAKVPRPINARSETAAQRPLFRAAWRERRCVVPATSFYEWSRTPAGKKLPWCIAPASGRLLHLAGLWEKAQDETDVHAYSFCVLTSPAGPDVGNLHDRQPVLLGETALDGWMAPNADAAWLAALCAPSPAGQLRLWRVGTAVNAVGNDGPELIRAVEDESEADDLPLLRF